MSGTKSLDWFEDYELQQQWAEDVFRVSSITPAPIPIRIAENTPVPVEKAIKDAARLFWSDHEAAANKLRQSIEHLLDHRKVVKTAVTAGKSGKPGKRVSLSLHARIQRFAKKDAENGRLLLAVKWIGNAGSHAGKADRGVVLEIFDMVEHVLEELYGTTRERLMARAKEINRHKGPKRLRRWRPKRTKTPPPATST